MDENSYEVGHGKPPRHSPISEVPIRKSQGPAKETEEPFPL